MVSPVTTVLLNRYLQMCFFKNLCVVGPFPVLRQPHYISPENLAVALQGKVNIQ